MLHANPWLLDQLNKNGFTAKLAAKSLLELGMDAKRVARLVQSVPADAWIVLAGSHEVLEWGSEQAVFVYALFGVKSRLPIAGIGVRRDLRPVVRQLVEQGHRRIVLMSRGAWVGNVNDFTAIPYCGRSTRQNFSLFSP